MLDVLADDENSSYITADELLGDAVYCYDYGSFISAFRNYLRADFANEKQLYLLSDGGFTASRDEAMQGERGTVEHITHGELSEQIFQRRLLSAAQAIKAKCEAGEIDGSV